MESRPESTRYTKYVINVIIVSSNLIRWLKLIKYSIVAVVAY